MTIATLAAYRAARRVTYLYRKSIGGIASTPTWTTGWDAVGNLSPAAGSLAIGNTANGIVPTTATTGAIALESFTGKGYLSAVDFSVQPSVFGAGVMVLYDRLFHAGTFPFNAAVTLASQPSFAGRVPGGTDFTGLQVWFECVTNFSGTISFTYTDQSGNAGHSSTLSGLALSLDRCVMLPLAPGDTGISKLESVTATVAASGTFNIFIARPLWRGRTENASADVHYDWLDSTGMPEIFPTSCLATLLRQDVGTGSFFYEMALEIASG